MGSVMKIDILNLIVPRCKKSYYPSWKQHRIEPSVRSTRSPNTLIKVGPVCIFQGPGSLVASSLEVVWPYFAEITTHTQTFAYSLVINVVRPCMAVPAL